MYPEIRIVRITETLGRYRSGALSCLEAAEVLGMSERHFRRLRDRHAAQGAEGLVDRRLGRASARAAPVDRIEWVLELYRTRYWDFTAKHFHEQLVRDHRFALGYTWTKSQLQKTGLVKKARRRGAHRKKRPRRPLPGMLLFQDGSTHRWLVDLGRALSQLGIEHIPSYSPEARGRIERLFGTLQGRLPQELRLAGITSIEAADRYLAEAFLPAFNALFAVPAAEAGSAFLAYVGRALADILAIQEARRVQNDNTLHYKRLTLQIPEQAHRRHFVKATVRVHEYPDGKLALFHGPRCLARYDEKGALLAQTTEKKVA